MSSVIPVLSVLKHSDEGLPTAPSLETKIPETSVEDPKVVSETIPSFKSKGKVKFKQKDDVYHKDTAGTFCSDAYRATFLVSSGKIG